MLAGVAQIPEEIFHGLGFHAQAAAGGVGGGVGGEEDLRVVAEQAGVGFGPEGIEPRARDPVLFECHYEGAFHHEFSTRGIEEKDALLHAVKLGAIEDGLVATGVQGDDVGAGESLVQRAEGAALGEGILCECGVADEHFGAEGLEQVGDTRADAAVADNERGGASHGGGDGLFPAAFVHGGVDGQELPGQGEQRGEGHLGDGLGGGFGCGGYLDAKLGGGGEIDIAYADTHAGDGFQAGRAGGDDGAVEGLESGNKTIDFAELLDGFRLGEATFVGIGPDLNPRPGEHFQWGGVAVSEG
jgi:hypothetical protein